MTMKKFSYYIPAILFLVVMLGSCEKDYLTPKKVEINTPVSFSKDVVPILTEDCAKAGCHVSGAHTPDLSASSAYDQLTGLGYVDTTNAEASILYKMITATTNPMPPNGKLTPDEIGYILAWIKQGAQNN